jgi:hypothetical protein
MVDRLTLEDWNKPMPPNNRTWTTQDDDQVHSPLLMAWNERLQEVTLYKFDLRFNLLDLGFTSPS